MKLEEKLVAVRKEKGLSQAELAEKLDVSRQAISRWERGTSAPSTDNLVCLAKLYGVSLDYLVGESTDRLQTEVEKSPEAECVPGGAAQETPAVRGKRKVVFSVAVALLVLLAVIFCGQYMRGENQEVVDIGTLEAVEVEISDTFGFKTW